MNSRWRLIPPLETSGTMQMAIDHYLLEQHRQGKYPPTIRFYTWNPFAISIGYHQKEYPPYWKNLSFQGQQIDIVRRPTGGRAVLHQGDLTYMVVTSLVPGKRLEVYKQICQFLISGWRSLGVNLDYGKLTKEYIQHHNCFATATGSDLVTETGNKVIGSAQLRRGQAILQHGSMLVDTDRKLYTQVFNTSLKQNLSTIISLENNCTRSKIIQNLTQAARATFKIDIVEQPLSTEEWQYIVRDLSLLRY